jgi:uncharacterized protein YlxW (UPF0749 family)
MKLERIISITRAQIILALALMLVGFGFVMQLHTYERLSERLETESEGDLAEIINQLDGEIEGIQGELLDERLKLMEYRNTNSDDETMINEARNEIAGLAKYTGAAEATGPGVIVTIENKERLLIGYDVRQAVEELRASGAWAISINNHRLDYCSSLWRKSGYIYLDGVKLKPDLKIEAIGPSKLLYQAITLPRGIRDRLNTLRGVQVDVREASAIRLGRIENKRDNQLMKPIDKVIKQ